MSENGPTVPENLPELLLAWFHKNARILPWRKVGQLNDPYRVWVSEIMLQQTRVEFVKSYYERFLAALPSIRALAEADENELLKLWEGLGYYSRVRNMQKASVVIQTEHGGVFPSVPEQVRALPGIGDYTAGAILSIAFGQREPAVDGNVLRVMSRVLGYTGELTPLWKKQLTEALRTVYPVTNAGDFTQSLMELGALVCLPNGSPLCEKCPLQQLCIAGKLHLTDRIPQKPVKKSRRVEKLTVLLAHCHGKLAVGRRPAKGLLSRMWELPNLSGWLTTDEISARFPGLQSVKRGRDAVHIFSHVEWHMHSYEVSLADEIPDWFWADEAQLESEIALPAAFRKLLKQ